jgi:serine protease Do
MRPTALLLKTAPVLLLIPLGALGGCHRPPPSGAAAASPSTPIAASALVAGAPPVSALPTTAAPFATPPVLPGTPDVAGLVAKIKPSVVNITTVHETRRAEQLTPGFPFGSEPGPFGPGRRPRGNDEVYKQQALGSGFIVDAAGHVVTNAHVVEDANQVKVRLSDEREFTAKVIGRDPRLDLAVLELLGAKDLPAAALGSSEQLRVGEYVVAIGNPFGLGHTVTMGIVSAKDRAIGAGPYDDFIQTDASINPGNSGGPLFNLKGEVVGINTAINPNGKGIGFAIPVDALKDVVGQLISTGKVARGRLGVTIQRVDPALGKALAMQTPSGALVAEVERGGPAERADLRPGDVILKVDSAVVSSSDDLPRIIARHAPGSRSTLEVLRGGKRIGVDVALGELKEEGASPEAPSGRAIPGADAPTGMGIEVGQAPGGKGEVVVGRVLPNSPADGQLRTGDVIVDVNREPVHTADDVVRRVKDTPPGNPVLLKIKRADKTMFVAVERR